MEIDAKLARHDLRQRRLADARRPDEQHVIERFAARFGRLDEDAEILRAASWPAKSASNCGRIAARPRGVFRPRRAGEERRPLQAPSPGGCRRSANVSSGRMVSPTARDEGANEARDGGASDKSMAERDPDAAWKPAVAGINARVGPDCHFERRPNRVEAQEEAIDKNPANESGDQRGGARPGATASHSA